MPNIDVFNLLLARWGLLGFELKYRITRGEFSAQSFVETHTDVTPDCCADSSTECKIYRHFKKVADSSSIDDASSRDSLLAALVCACEECTSVGGADNGKLEGIFSLRRALGLKLVIIEKIRHLRPILVLGFDKFGR